MERRHNNIDVAEVEEAKRMDAATLEEVLRHIPAQPTCARFFWSGISGYTRNRISYFSVPEGELSSIFGVKAEINTVNWHIEDDVTNDMFLRVYKQIEARTRADTMGRQFFDLEEAHWFFGQSELPGETPPYSAVITPYGCTLNHSGTKPQNFDDIIRVFDKAGVASTINYTTPRSRASYSDS